MHFSSQLYTSVSASMNSQTRSLEAYGENLSSLGAALGNIYRPYIVKGLKRSRELYEAEPVTVSKASTTCIQETQIFEPISPLRLNGVSCPVRPRTLVKGTNAAS